MSIQIGKPVENMLPRSVHSNVGGILKKFVPAIAEQIVWNFSGSLTNSGVTVKVSNSSKV
jgi:hypothetical protein